MKIQDISLFESYSTAKQVFGREASPEEVTKSLEQFKALNQRNMLKPEEKDLGKWIRAGWDKFDGFVRDASSRVSGKEKKTAVKNNAIRVAENDQWLVIIPLTMEASCFYGKNTQWCTSATQSKNHFVEYFHGRDKVILFYFMSKTSGEKLALTFDKQNGWRGFDANDNNIEMEDVTSATGFSSNELAGFVTQNIGRVSQFRKESEGMFASDQGVPPDVYQRIKAAIDKQAVYSDDRLKSSIKDWFDSWIADEDELPPLDEVIEAIAEMFHAYAGDIERDVESDLAALQGPRLHHYIGVVMDEIDVDQTVEDTIKRSVPLITSYYKHLTANSR